MAEQKIIDLKINSKEAFDKLRELDEELAVINKRMKENTKEDADAVNQYEHDLAIKKDLTRQQRELRKVLENTVRQHTMEATSLKGLRAELSNLTQQYDELSKVEREGASGAELQKRIVETSNTIKEAEENTNRFYRNVGNYKSALTGLFDNSELGKWFNTFKGGLDMLTDSMPKADKEVMKTGNIFVKSKTLIINGINGINKALLSLLANPIVLAIAAVVAAIALVVKALNNSEERTEKLKMAMSSFQPIIDAVQNVLGKLADVLAAVIGFYADMYGAVISAIGAFTDFIGVTENAADTVDNYNKITQEEIALEHERRNQKISSAKQDLQVAQLRDKLAKTDKKNTKEREQLLKQAIDIEQQKADKDLELAKREYENLKAKQALTENDKEANDALAEAEAKMYQAQTNHLQETRKLQQQLTAMREENAKAAEEEAKKEEEAAKKAAEAAKKAAEERKKAYDKQVQEQRKAQDLLIKLIKDANERAREEENTSYARQIADLKKRLAEEKNLTIQARVAINKQIQLLEKIHQEALTKLDADAETERLQKIKDEYDMEVEALDKNSDKLLDTKLKALAAERDVELSNTELTERQKYLIRQKYAKQEAEMISEDTSKRQAEAQAATERAAQIELAQLKVKGAGAVEIAQAEADQAAEAFATMTQKEGEKDDEFQLRLLNAQQNAIDKEKALTERRKEQQEQTEQGYLQIAESLNSVAQAVGAGTKAEAAMKRVSAALGIVTSGVALAKSVSSAASAPWPANIAAVAGAVAQMVPIIANIKTLAGYAEGGTITNGTTGTADDVQIMASRGEAVMTARAVRMYSPLLSAMNQSAGGAPVTSVASGESVNGNNFLAQQMASALAAMPAPRVAVTDFIDAQNRLNTVRIQSRI